MPSSDSAGVESAGMLMRLAQTDTPCHQALLVKLPKAGPIVLSGDLTAHRCLRLSPEFYD